MTSATKSREAGEMIRGRDQLVPLILRSMDVALETVLSKEVHSVEARNQLDILRTLLFWSVSWLEQGAALEAQRATAMQPLLAAGNSTADTNSLLKALEGETEFYRHLDPESIHDPSTAYSGGKSLGRPSFSATERPIDEDRLTAYVRCRFPEHADATASSVKVLTGGMSKDTILFELTGAGPLDGGVVLRKDFNQRGSDYSAIDEYPLIQAMYAAGLPVPEPLWSEPDANALGSPFIAVRKVDGVAALSESFEDPATRRHFCDRLAEMLARIHAIPLDRLNIYGDRARLCVSDLLVRQIEEWRNFWCRIQIERDPAMDFLFDWMIANLPAEPAYAAAVVHGDYGFHNLMTQHGEVTAVLDWEFAHPGDRMEDIGYVRQFLAPLGLWDQFLADYTRHGGVPFDAERSHYFEIWQNVRNACLCAGALNAFARGRPGHLRMASAGLALLPRFKLGALRQISEVLTT